MLRRVEIVDTSLAAFTLCSPRARGGAVFSRNYRFGTAAFATMVGFGLSLWSRPSQADVSTWLSIAGGVGQVQKLDWDRRIVPTFRLGTGMGSDPSRSWIVGGMLRSDTWIGEGTDLSLALRVANHGYANGQWGLALDLGPVARFWGPDAYGGLGVATLGMPWGLEAGLTATFGNEPVRSYGGFIGIDLARLTVYRRSGSSWWKNPFPAYRTPEEQAH